MRRFDHYVAIDWSGAVGPVQPGIAIALCGAGGSPRLVDRRWSRAAVLEWLMGDLPPHTLVGLDLGLSLPFADRDAFFPGWPESPPDARALWALVDRLSAGDPHLAASSFVDHPELARHFRRHGGRTGDLFGGGRGRLRVTEEHQRAAGLNPYSNLNLVGAAQVGKSSLTGMRVLHRLGGTLPIWPFDPAGNGPVIVEIYTTIAALAGGRAKNRAKMRTIEDLNATLAALGSPPVSGGGPIDDHRSDALATAAWLRTVADEQRLWHPPALTERVRRTEGWTFGIA